MRTFSELDKDVAKRLLSNHGEKHGFEVLSDCFSMKSLAVFLMGKDSSYMLYAKDCDNNTLLKSKQRLMSVLSILDYMEQEGMIYVIDSLSSDLFFLHELNDHNVAVVKENHRYSFEKGTVECQSGKCVVKDTSYSDIMKVMFVQIYLHRNYGISLLEMYMIHRHWFLLLVMVLNCLKFYNMKKS